MQHAVDEDRGSHRIERHPDALSFQVSRSLDAGFAVDGDIAEPERDRGEHRDGDERALLAGEALGEFGAGILRYVKFLAARHAVENRPRLIDGDEIEIDAIGLDLARIERLHPIVEPARERKLQLGHWSGALPYCDCGLRLACRKRSRKAGAAPQICYFCLPEAHL